MILLFYMYINVKLSYQLFYIKLFWEVKIVTNGQLPRFLLIVMQMAKVTRLDLLLAEKVSHYLI